MTGRLFLTRDEVAELTGGRTRAVQIRVLQSNGTRHFINASGWPVVPISAVTGERANPNEKEMEWRSALDDPRTELQERASRAGMASGAARRAKSRNP